MDQLTQQLKSGKMEILEVPFPTMNDNQILVRNLFSVVSAGTEGKTVSDARKGYIAKAKSRQKELKMVINMVKSQGLSDTYKFVMNKLEAASPLGYSCAGEVIAVGKNIHDIKIGDYVACGGQGAFHAEIVSVEKNLCVKVPKEVSLKEASFATIASIAMQGVRQADVRIGEYVAVIGLGLVGQITIQLLNAAGIKTIGIDINPAQVALAKENGASVAICRNQSGIESIINESTNGYGVDAVIITAGTSSLDPVEFAGTIARKKGKVIVVGAVPTGFSRAEYYKKELELKMSCSYGPGRYDSNFEEKGIDYPYGYVRWTENRNMQAFVELLASGKVNLKHLITHEFTLDNAPDAYQMIVDKSEPFIGIVIKYDEDKEIDDKKVEISHVEYKPQDVNVAFIGAGNFAQGTLLPRLVKMEDVHFVGVMSAHGNNSRYVAGKYHFNYCTDKSDELLKDDNVNTVFVCTRHNLHAQYVIDAIGAGKNVFVEKPLAMNCEELEAVKEAYTINMGNNRLMVGFNRRFSPAVQQIMKTFTPEQPKAINIRVNAGVVPKDNWNHDREIGGGRIIGEGCHFIDLAMYIAGSKVKTVSAKALQNADHLNDTVCVSLSFENGSIASISYFSNGNKNVSKEQIEVFCDGTVAQINDFVSLTISGRNTKVYKYKQNKGHSKELEMFCKSIKDGKDSPISFQECYDAMKVTFEVVNQL